MKLLRTLFGNQIATRFDRYYGDVIRAGVGYPTADEARRDLAGYERTAAPHGWLR